MAKMLAARVRKFYNNGDWFDEGPSDTDDFGPEDIGSCTVIIMALEFLQENQNEIEVISINEVWLDHKREIHIWYYKKEVSNAAT